YLVIIAFCAWMYGRFNRPDKSRIIQWIFTVIAILLAVYSGIILLRFDKTTVPSEHIANEHYRDGWQQFSPALVQEYISQDQPVFIEFRAEWCMTCKLNERNVLYTEEIENAFSEKGVQLLIGDNTQRNDIISEWLMKFNRAGVPLYIFYRPGEENPVVLPEIITKDMIYNELDKL
ncbi:MAG: thioredoxin family protein, partial [Candidatus Cloacimonetes bacterium]|nr:thioredoxin family protein [Candidatus Cloacimonadota bacterium]